ncbi:MAG: hypothetical protein AB1646_05055 [Thermodesulfobacteriota bacterium]
MGRFGGNRGYRVDRSLLEEKSTKEIVRILEEEREDYTQEAIEILEDILRRRGVAVDSELDAGPEETPSSDEVRIMSAGDAITVMNEVLNGVLQGTIDPEVGEAAAHIAMCILQALDQRMVQGTGDHT